MILSNTTQGSCNVAAELEGIHTGPKPSGSWSTHAIEMSVFSAGQVILLWLQTNDQFILVQLVKISTK